MSSMPLLAIDRQREIENGVSGLCSRLVLNYPDNGIMEFCRALDIEVKAVTFKRGYENISGMCRSNSGTLNSNPEIYLNIQNSPERQTFTIAHEIGHLQLGHATGDVIRIDRFNYLEDTNNQETEANFFAASILVPRFKLEESYEAFGGNVSAISKFFRVSPLMIETRLDWLKRNTL